MPVEGNSVDIEARLDRLFREYCFALSETTIFPIQAYLYGQVSVQDMVNNRSKEGPRLIQHQDLTKETWERITLLLKLEQRLHNKQKNRLSKIAKALKQIAE